MKGVIFNDIRPVAAKVYFRGVTRQEVVRWGNAPTETGATFSPPPLPSLLPRETLLIDSRPLLTATFAYNLQVCSFCGRFVGQNVPDPPY